jgi:DNA-binding NtrC family response regulator
VTVDPAVLSAFARYRWPGNVRELQNVLERAVLLSDGSRVRADDIPGLEGEEAPAASSDGRETDGLTLDQVERAHIERTLERCSGNKTEAARKLGVSLRTLYRKLEKLGIK